MSPLTKGLDVRGNLSVSRDGQSMAFLRQNAESPRGRFLRQARPVSPHASCREELSKVQLAAH